MLQILLPIAMAAIPAYIWGVIFWLKDPVYKPRAALTFLAGLGSVIPILFYKWSWTHLPQANIFNYTQQFQGDLLHFAPALYLPIGTVFAFMFVGVIEEYMKHWVVKISDKGFFRNIDDAIEFSIIAALGFAFVENVLYFYYIWEFQGGNVLMVSFIFRSVFSTFAHVLFSGVYGYFYGVAYFADPVWSEKERKKRHPLIKFFHKVMHFKSDRVFAVEKITEGLFFATFLHSIFNLLLEMNITAFMVPFLIFGYTYLDHLFKKKENLKAYGCLVGEESPSHIHQMLWNKVRCRTAVQKGEVAEMLNRD